MQQYFDTKEPAEEHKTKHKHCARTPEFIPCLIEQETNAPPRRLRREKGVDMSPEYLQSRCCMCPNIQKNVRTCPGIPGSLHPVPSPCRFVKAYTDERGWKYKVMSGIGQNTFKARYQKPEKHGPETGWKGLGAVPWRTTFDEAQADLNAYAKKKGWSEWG